jgi:hypothetical protein
MLVNPARRRVVVCEDLLSPRAFREALLHVLFADFKVRCPLYRCGSCSD